VSEFVRSACGDPPRKSRKASTLIWPTGLRRRCRSASDRLGGGARMAERRTTRIGRSLPDAVAPNRPSPCENAKVLGFRESLYPSRVANRPIRGDLKGRLLRRCHTERVFTRPRSTADGHISPKRSFKRRHCLSRDDLMTTPRCTHWTPCKSARRDAVSWIARHFLIAGEPTKAASG
jgi:hypothetical protein